MLANFLFAQDSLKTVILDDVTVYATRANEKTPMTYSSVAKEELNERNLGQDLPILLNFTPSIVTTSDAGAGIGYTGMRIRGSDATRINVTINGIPVNDSESHGVFWVNMPDFASSLSSVQIQRGVGTSSNGAAAFGATVNLQTNNVSPSPFFQTDNTVGSFNTFKSNVTYNTGLINEVFNFEARLSRINSDGYIDRSEADLRSYYLSGGRFGKKTMIKAVLFGGQEITQQAWFGTPQARLTGDPDAIQAVIDFGGEYTTQEQVDNLRNSDRRFNYYLYDNEVDDYRQDHYQLHIGHTFSDLFNFSGALHYTRGRGFFEQFRNDDDLVDDYGLSDIIIGGETITTSDIVRRRWLDNHFYGFTYAFNYAKDKIDATIGGAYNEYDGDHFGEIIWAQFAGNVDIRDRYYEGNGLKKDFNSYVKVNYSANDALNLFGDVQIRKINYVTNGLDNDLEVYDVDTDFTFFNPKIGLTYTLNENTSLYASYAIGNREPVRSDFIDADTGEVPEHETLKNLEMGIRSFSEDFSYEINLFSMNYENQLVLTGEVNDVGAPVRTNVPKSSRMGVELSGAYKLTNNVTWTANLTLSQNRIDNFTQTVFDYGETFEEFNIIETNFSDSDISFSPNVIAASDFTYSPTTGLSLQLLTKYVGKQYLDNTSNENRIIDVFLTNDVRVAYDFQPNGLKNVGLSLLVNNVFNEEYSSNGYTWGYNYGPNLYQQNNYFPQAGTNFLLGLSLKF